MSTYDKERVRRMRCIQNQQLNDTISSIRDEYSIKIVEKKTRQWGRGVKRFFRNVRRALFGLNAQELEQRRQQKMCKG